MNVLQLNDQRSEGTVILMLEILFIIIIFIVLLSRLRQLDGAGMGLNDTQRLPQESRVWRFEGTQHWTPTHLPPKERLKLFGITAWPYRQFLVQFS